MSTLQTTAVPPAPNRPAEPSSRLSNGAIPLVIVVIVIAAYQVRKRRAQREAEARDVGPPQ
ncbi:MAG TPA: hypothetical protein VFI52_10160 [Gemmatimonadaceae bacterium]|nr:hypothetical protein [Gemmatimonadaceae bacterium]